MSMPGSVTRWVSQLKAGDREVLAPIWERYFKRLVGLAHKQLDLAAVRPAGADPEGVAVSAFASFWKGLQRGQFDKLFDSDDLFNLLARITIHKAGDLADRQKALKRSPEVGGSAFGSAQDSSSVGFELVLSQEPSPDLVVEMEEQYRRLLDCLGDDELRQIAVWRTEGCTVEEIAGKLGWGVRSVYRSLEEIRRLWEREVEP
jgi:DNA-directed RNA polymerase specialized sigma24 family protein